MNCEDCNALLVDRAYQCECCACPLCCTCFEPSGLCETCREFVDDDDFDEEFIEDYE